MVAGLSNVITKGFLVTVNDQGFFALGTNELFGVKYSIWILIVAAFACGFVLSRTKFGRWLYAVGGNPEAARLSGINTRAMKVAAFTFSGSPPASAGRSWSRAPRRAGRQRHRRRLRRLRGGRRRRHQRDGRARRHLAHGAGHPLPRPHHQRLQPARRSSPSTSRSSRARSSSPRWRSTRSRAGPRDGARHARLRRGRRRLGAAAPRRGGCSTAARPWRSSRPAARRPTRRSTTRALARAWRGSRSTGSTTPSRRRGAPGAGCTGRAARCGRVGRAQRDGLDPRPPPGLRRLGLPRLPGLGLGRRAAGLPLARGLRPPGRRLHGVGGPVRVMTRYEPHPMLAAMVAAAQEAGVPFNDDHNGETLDGVGYSQLTIRDGVRETGASAFIDPVADHDALTRPHRRPGARAALRRRALHGRRGRRRGHRGRPRGRAVRRHARVAQAAHARRHRAGRRARAPRDRGRASTRPASGATCTTT